MLLSIRFERVTLKSDLDKMMALVQRKKVYDRNALHNVSKEIQETCEDLEEAVSLKRQADLIYR